MSNEKVLTKEIAEQFLENKRLAYFSEVFCGEGYFSKFTAIEDAAAESLSKHKGYLDLRGLTSLSDAAAKSLGKHKGDLALYGLTSLSDATAEILSKHEGSLTLYSLTSLSDEAAESLSKYEGRLSLDLDNIPESAAAILRQHQSLRTR
jgi:hypothetical protein